MKSFDETTPLDELLKALPQNEIDELSALGDTRDDTRWRIGDITRHWVDDENMPVGSICKIVGKLTDYGHERVRQLLYNSRYYHEHPELRDRYLNLRYSIFEHARACNDPEAVLREAMDGNLSVNQVKFAHPPLWDEIKDIYTRIPKQHEQEANQLVKLLLAKLRELMDK
jgi:hypothetical protein